MVTLAMLVCALLLVGCSGTGRPLVSPSPATKTGPYFPLEKLTSGPAQHWFGYYDKQQVDPTGRYVLAARTDTFFRSPTARDTLRIGVIDTRQNNAWRELGTSTAWGWQQGCMLQWIPNSGGEVIWNDRAGDHYVSRIMNVHTGESRTLPRAIYTLSKGGDFALGTEFNRIQNLRPGYGYAGIEDPYEKVKAPAGIGIYRMDLQTGESELLISIADMAAVPNLGEDLGEYWNYFNHLLISPNDQRFVFLHRWRKELGERSARASGGFITRMVTADTKDGGDRYVLDPSGHTSHFIWKGNDILTMWTQPVGKPWGFYEFTDRTEQVSAVGAVAMPDNGHNTYLAGTNNEWIINDTYPKGSGRLQELYLYHVPTDTNVMLGRFHQPLEFAGEWRCDLHPKSGPNGDYVYFDSTFGDDGRQVYRIDVRQAIK